MAAARGFGILVIAQHDDVAAGAQLALLVVAQRLAGGRIDDLDFDAGQRPADGFDAQLERIVGAGLRDDRRGFGLAVGDRDFAARPSRSTTCSHDLDRARAARHDAGPQRRQVAAGEARDRCSWAMNIVGTP